jgi:hypothetical protein
MLLRNTIIAAICGSALAAPDAFAQENPTSKTEHRIEACVAFAETTNADRAQQSPNVNYGFLGGHRSFFSKYSSANLSDANTSNAQAHVVLAVYVFRIPVKRWSPFVLTGAPLFDLRTDVMHRIYPRTKHRGEFYNSGTFNTGGLNDLYRFSNDLAPPVVLGYTF